MTAVNLSSDGEEKLEEIRDTFEIEPSKRKVVEKGLEMYHEKRVIKGET
jgi:uncharacterized protein YajQ (UPF0234 family)